MISLRGLFVANPPEIYFPATSSLAGPAEKRNAPRMINDVVDLLCRLVRLPSVNPDNTPGTPHTGERALAEFLRDLLTSLGAVVVLEDVLPDRPNVIARFAPVDGRPRILLGPHLDTVGVSGMANPFGAEIHSGKLWGRGASDTKGSMAAMLWALGQHQHLLTSLPIAVDFVAFMGEESGQWGSKHFAAHHASDYQFALVGEPTSMQVVHVTKGSLWATLQARGRAAHSSVPERGDNAVMKLARSLDLLDHSLHARLASFTHPMLGSSTHNIGVIRGGSRPNIVPDLAEAEMDIRITPSLAAAGGAMQQLREVIESHHLPLEIVKSHENPPMETDAEHPMIRRLLACDPAVQLGSAPWFSDAAHLSRANIPSICIGPGSIDQAHTLDEFIKLTDLHQGAQIFSLFLQSLSLPFTPG